MCYQLIRLIYVSIHHDKLPARCKFMQIYYNLPAQYTFISVCIITILLQDVIYANMHHNNLPVYKFMSVI